MHVEAKMTLKNTFLPETPLWVLSARFICKNTTFLLNKFFSRMKLKFWLFGGPQNILQNWFLLYLIETVRVKSREKGKQFWNPHEKCHIWPSKKRAFHRVSFSSLRGAKFPDWNEQSTLHCVAWPVDFHWFDL